MRVLTGIQATGELHLGNYLGAIKPLAGFQEKGEMFFFIPNLHSLNVRPDASQLREETLANVAWMLAAGCDPQKSVIFAQSQIPAHSELTTILMNYVTMGELSRMTQYKDKQARFGAAGQLTGLFTYPVLMAADILLYDADVVPVGEDQKQHVELTRDIAERFNNLHGEVFKVPEISTSQVGARVMSLQDATKKMSKSDIDINGKVLLTDTPSVIESKFKKAVTDSGASVELSDTKPAISNLLHIYAALSGEDIEKVQQKFSSSGYGDFKTQLGRLAAEQISSLQDSYRKHMQDEQILLAILERGRERAQVLAEAKMSQVKKVLGLL